MSTPTAVPFQELARDLYAEVEQAGRVMTGADTVPAEVAKLIDKVADRLETAQRGWGVQGVDPYLGQALLAAALSAEKGLRHDNEAARRRQVRLALERLRQALRDILDEAPTDEDAPIQDVLGWLLSVLAAPQTEVAALLGVSPRTFQRWVAGTAPSRPSGADEARLRAVARVVGHLRHVFTGPGVLRWFDRGHPDLGGQAPRELLADPLALPRLVRLASRARSTVAG